MGPLKRRVCSVESHFGEGMPREQRRMFGLGETLMAAAPVAVRASVRREDSR